MRALQINQLNFFYALRPTPQEFVTPEGFATGEFYYPDPQPIAAKGTLSAAKGSVEEELSGIETPYDYRLLVYETLPIVEDSYFWIGTDPTKEPPGKCPPTHEIVAIAKSLNTTVYAIRKIRGAK